MCNKNTIIHNQNMNLFRLPRDCLSLIYEYDSTFSDIFQQHVLQIDTKKHKKRKGWEKEFLFYKKVMEARMKQNPRAKIPRMICLTNTAMIKDGHLSYMHDHTVLENRVIPQKNIQKWTMEYERRKHRYIVFPDNSISLEQFLVSFMDYYHPRIHLKDMVVLWFSEDYECSLYVSEQTMFGYMETYTKTKELVRKEIRHSKMYVYVSNTHFNYVLKFYRIQDTMVLYIDFNQEEIYFVAMIHGMTTEAFRQKLHNDLMYDMIRIISAMPPSF